MLRRSRSASVQFSTPSFLLVSTSSLFFLLLFSAPLFVSFLRQLFLFFSSWFSFLFSSCVPFFSAQKHSFQPKTILSSGQTFLLQFSHSSLLLFFCFILFWFSHLFSLSAPPFFLFFSFVYPRPNILSSCFTYLLFE